MRRPRIVTLELVVHVIHVQDRMRKDGQTHLNHGKLATLIQIEQLHVDLLGAVTIDPGFVVVRLILLLIVIYARQKFVDFFEVLDGLIMLLALHIVERL